MALTAKTDDKLGMANALKLLEEVGDIIRDYDGAGVNVDGENNKDRMRRNAEISRDLLYAAHVADLARAEILNQYHRFKGATPPEVIA